jgi:hypothetical protein
MPLTAKVTLNLNALQTSQLDLALASAPLLKDYITSLQNGTAAGQADKIFHDQRTLAAAANEDLDLNGAALSDAFNTTLAFVKVKGLIVSAAAANPNPITLGGAASNGFISWVGSATDKVSIRPGATFALFAGQADGTGYAVTAATADLLRVTAGAGGNHTYDVIVIGTSA